MESQHNFATLRVRRLVQLMIALCASAFLSALISFALYRILSLTALPLSGSNIANDIQSINDIGKLKELSVAFVGLSTELRNSGETLTKWGLGFVLVWSTILGTVALTTYREITKASKAPIEPAVENVFDRALAGKLELWKVFWGGYVALSLLLFFIFIVTAHLFTQVEAIKSSFLFNALACPIALSIPYTFYLLCALLVWRSASNTSSVVWCYLAKAFVIVFTAFPIIRSVYAVSVALR